RGSRSSRRDGHEAAGVAAIRARRVLPRGALHAVGRELSHLPSAAPAHRGGGVESVIRFVVVFILDSLEAVRHGAAGRNIVRLDTSAALHLGGSASWRSLPRVA